MVAAHNARHLGVFDRSPGHSGRYSIPCTSLLAHLLPVLFRVQFDIGTEPSSLPMCEVIVDNSEVLGIQISVLLSPETQRQYSRLRVLHCCCILLSPRRPLSSHGDACQADASTPWHLSHALGPGCLCPSSFAWLISAVCDAVLANVSKPADVAEALKGHTKPRAAFAMDPGLMAPMP